MLVCLCHSVTERELTQAVDLGLSTMEELRRDLSIGASCGSCADFASRVLAAHLERKAEESKEDGARR
jgi:bacterioferritin-associated ferredoxin